MATKYLVEANISSNASTDIANTKKLVNVPMLASYVSQFGGGTPPGKVNLVYSATPSFDGTDKWWADIRLSGATCTLTINNPTLGSYLLRGQIMQTNATIVLPGVTDPAVAIPGTIGNKFIATGLYDGITFMWQIAVINWFTGVIGEDSGTPPPETFVDVVYNTLANGLGVTSGAWSSGSGQAYGIMTTRKIAANSIGKYVCDYTGADNGAAVIGLRTGTSNTNYINESSVGLYDYAVFVGLDGKLYRQETGGAATAVIDGFTGIGYGLETFDDGGTWKCRIIVTSNGTTWTTAYTFTTAVPGDLYFSGALPLSGKKITNPKTSGSVTA